MASVLRWLPLGLLALLTSCGPVYRAWAEPGAAAPIGSAEPDPRRLLGTWALTDNDNPDDLTSLRYLISAQLQLGNAAMIMSAYG